MTTKEATKMEAAKELAEARQPREGDHREMAARLNVASFHACATALALGKFLLTPKPQDEKR